mmetsp:Transcript_32455/g.59491  ORF Transcript_32455/g.59491 Transcript_32455/m.59491 type:complete len:312 (+) Transcript_32455:112-1047(+)
MEDLQDVSSRTAQNQVPGARPKCCVSGSKKWLYVSSIAILLTIVVALFMYPGVSTANRVLGCCLAGMVCSYSFALWLQKRAHSLARERAATRDSQQNAILLGTIEHGKATGIPELLLQFYLGSSTAQCPTDAAVQKINADGCIICLQGYDDQDSSKRGEIVIKLPCNHLFHKPCIGQWLVNHSSCPLCNADVSETINSLWKRRMERQLSDEETVVQKSSVGAAGIVDIIQCHSPRSNDNNEEVGSSNHRNVNDIETGAGGYYLGGGLVITNDDHHQHQQVETAADTAIIITRASSSGDDDDNSSRTPPQQQ